MLCKKYGFDVTGSFMMAAPGEKIEDMQKTVKLMNWMKNQGAIEIWCGVTKPYPGTQLWEYGIKNRLIDKNFNLDLVDPSYIHNPIFLDKSISKKEFYKIFKLAKQISFETSIRGKENMLVRKVKDIVYYNKLLYDGVKLLTKIKPTMETVR
jgi:radical SAM superfamily enzyme YgiQ (UPF0313 family)